MVMLEICWELQAKIFLSSKLEERRYIPSPPDSFDKFMTKTYAANTVGEERGEPADANGEEEEE